MRVLIACEFSGIVRDAFTEKGHDAWSCDLLPTERPGKHLQCDVLEVADGRWDLMIAHPPCTHLASSGARWFKLKEKEQAEGIAFVLALASAPIPRMALENPVGVLSTKWRKPDQIIQPWMFGDDENKATCLWTKGLPKLIPSVVSFQPRKDRVHRMAPGPNRWKERSRTPLGVARAMADQWGSL